MQRLVASVWFYKRELCNQFQAYFNFVFRIYLIVPEVGGKPMDSGKPVNLLRKPCYYLTSFVKTLPVIFISRYFRRLVAFIRLVNFPQYCGMVNWSYYAYFVGVSLNATATSPAEQVISSSP